MEKGAENKRVIEGFSEKSFASKDKRFMRDYFLHLDEEEKKRLAIILLSMTDKLHSLFISNKDKIEKIIDDAERIHTDIIEQAKKNVIEAGNIVSNKEQKTIHQIFDDYIKSMQDLLPDKVRDNTFTKEIEHIKKEITQKEEKLSSIKRYNTLIELSNILASFSDMDETTKATLSVYIAEYSLYLRKVFFSVELPDKEEFKEFKIYQGILKSLPEDKEKVAEEFLKDESFREKLRVSLIRLTDILIDLGNDVSLFFEEKPYIDYIEKIEGENTDFHVSRKEFSDFHTAIDKRTTVLYGQILSLANLSRNLYETLSTLEGKEAISSKEIIDILKEIIHIQTTTINTVIGEYIFLSKLRDAVLDLEKEDLNVNQSVSKAYNTLLFELRKSALRLELLYQLFSNIQNQELSSLKENVKQIRDEYVKTIKDLVEIVQMDENIINNYESALASAEKTIENYESALASAEKTIENYKEALKWSRLNFEMADERAKSHFEDLISYMNRYG